MTHSLTANMQRGCKWMIMTFLLRLCLCPPPTQPCHGLLRQQIPPQPPCIFPSRKKILKCHFIPTKATKWQIENQNNSPSSLWLQILDFHNGHIHTLSTHKGLLLPYRRCPLMIPYLQNTKAPLPLAYGMHKGAFSLLTLNRSESQLKAKHPPMGWTAVGTSVGHKQHSLFPDISNSKLDQSLCDERNPPPPSDISEGETETEGYILQIRMYKSHGMTFSTLMWKSKTKIIECVISGATHKGMTPMKTIPHSGARHHPFRVTLKKLEIAEVCCRRQ